MSFLATANSLGSFDNAQSPHNTACGVYSRPYPIIVVCHSAQQAQAVFSVQPVFDNTSSMVDVLNALSHSYLVKYAIKSFLQLKYYCVIAGRDTRIYLTWDECEEQISGLKHQKHKSFNKLPDTLRYYICKGDGGPVESFNAPQEDSPTQASTHTRPLMQASSHSQPPDADSDNDAVRTLMTAPAIQSPIPIAPVTATVPPINPVSSASIPPPPTVLTSASVSAADLDIGIKYYCE
ncbi:hypothetical protein BKA93DRAFT_828748 [Sparassis latifolia]